MWESEKPFTSPGSQQDLRKLEDASKPASNNSTNRNHIFPVWALWEQPAQAKSCQELDADTIPWYPWRSLVSYRNMN